ncbi:elongation factor 1-beta [Archaeoglobus profundus]|uniref:Elongation factor 1-beta n=1 Tax=Archaeoglobus profundus (strain DSM 5631 / JCM 9629 / NBRC 100127 / Av18) TaxID=572546 RepID=D2RI89_ARCPA|nr:elongation factor 1-beta [Archaeoglobus profundus]ADB58014.1 translation elongation factor aEF-1 beta [Archaeoglobus profundus DSM 5631]
MGKVYMKLRVMPEDVDIDLEKIYEKIKEVAPENVEIKDYKIQPIAFGLKALLIVAVMPDEGEIGDQLVERIQNIDGVESVEVEATELL